MKARTKAMLSYLSIVTALILLEIFFGLMKIDSGVTVLLSVWCAIPIWEFYVAKDVSND